MGGTCCSRQRAARLCSASAGVTNQLLFPLDLVLYCEAFLTTYRTFITPEELIKKLQYRYPSGPQPWPTPHTLSLPSTAPLQGKAGSSCPLSHPVVGSGWGCSALLCHVLSGTSGQPSSLSLLPVCDRAEVRFCEVPGTESVLPGRVVITG